MALVSVEISFVQLHFIKINLSDHFLKVRIVDIQKIVQISGSEVKSSELAQFVYVT